MDSLIPVNQMLAERAESMARFLMMSRAEGHEALCEYCEAAIAMWADEIIARTTAELGR